MRHGVDLVGSGHARGEGHGAPAGEVEHGEPAEDEDTCWEGGGLREPVCGPHPSPPRQALGSLASSCTETDRSITKVQELMERNNGQKRNQCPTKNQREILEERNGGPDNHIDVQLSQKGKSEIKAFPCRPASAMLR